MRAIAFDERVAVTIATKNRPAYLVALLASLAQQTYPHWLLVLNDQSDIPVPETAAVRDLLTLLETLGHRVIYFSSTTPTDRYQRLLDETPSEIEFVHRIDDDVLLTPTYLENMLSPFRYFPDRPVAAVGGCLGAANAKPMSLETALREPRWYPQIDKPTWRMQGHFYHEQEVIEMASLWGCAMCYRRSAVMAVGGWHVPGQSPQIFREDSDMSARLVMAGFALMMTTEALGWHLVAPDGGAREVTKTARGNLFNSHRDEYNADETLFRERLAALVPADYQPPAPKRYRLADLEMGQVKPQALLKTSSKIYGSMLARLPRGVRQKLRAARRRLSPS